MHLVADVLDQQVLDKTGKRAGRVDGIVLEVREGKPPLITHVEVSPITLLARLNRRLAERYARWDQRLGKGRGVPFRIPWSRLEQTGKAWRFDTDAEDTPILALEDWLRVKIVERIPGG
jgi:sporulation protein YlmC with PRC-barrel domain